MRDDFCVIAHHGCCASGGEGSEEEEKGAAFASACERQLARNLASWLDKQSASSVASE